jgi:hypothetical protein
MARKKNPLVLDNEFEGAEEVLDEAPRTRPVKVSSVTREEYVREDPVIDPEDEAGVILEDEAPPDLFSTFNEIAQNNQNSLLRIWRLPNYDIDGKSSTRSTEREYCGSVEYDASAASLIDQIRGRVPEGGMLTLELFFNGGVRKRGLLRVKPQAQAAGTATQHGASVVINQPANDAAISPVEMMREQMKLAKDLVSMARDLQPPAPTINVGGATESEANTTQDRLLETVLIKALERDKTPIDRVLEVLSGRGAKEPTLMETLAPIIGEVLKAFAPTINAAIQRNAAAAAPGHAPPAAAPQLATPAGGPVAAPAVDPVNRAWFRVVLRMLEDCTEHVELSKVSGDRISVIPSAEAIADLAGRFPEQLTPTIQTLITSTPENVLELCAMMLDAGGQEHIRNNLMPYPAAAAWIAELQTECTRIFNETSEPIDANDEQRDGGIQS